MLIISDCNSEKLLNWSTETRDIANNKSGTGFFGRDTGYI